MSEETKLVMEASPESLLPPSEAPMDAKISPSVARQDSGVLEELVSPGSDSDKPNEDDPNGTMNSDCNITVIHITESEGYKVAQAAANATSKKGEKDYAAENKESKDGSDSGVEGCATEITRVRSRNSVDYTSSCNNLDEASCDSSLVSCCSVYEEACTTLPDDRSTSENCIANATTGEGTSEGGSESSSIAGSVSARVSRIGNSSKRCATSSTSSCPGKRKTVLETPRSSRSRNGSIPNSAAGTSVTATPRSKSRSTTPRNILSGRAQSRTREKSTARDQPTTPTPSTITTTTGCRTTSSRMTASYTSQTRTRTRPLPDSLPSSLTTEINRDLAQRARSGSTQRQKLLNGTSTSRYTVPTRTPSSTPSEESKKISSSRTPYVARTESLRSSRVDRMSSSMDNKALDAYATLPRRTRAKPIVTKPCDTVKDRSTASTRSRSGSRDASLGRQQKERTASKDSSHKSLPPYPKHRSEKTRIFHEMSIQTGLTGDDIDKALSGVAPSSMSGCDVIERLPAASQTEGTWEDMTSMQAELKRLTEENAAKRKENQRLTAELGETKRLLDEERADHAFARQELDRNAQRVMAMLGTPQSEHAEGGDSLLELESQIQSSGQVVASQQIEIADLQSLCRMLSRDLEKSLAAQKSLLQQQQELEAEAAEMQDFLQQEKATLAEALKEVEIEMKKKDEILSQREIELSRQTEECKHLVRISEQRRQENLSISMKLNAVERRCRELLLTQGATVSGAAVALSSLSTRLEGLVEQLITSYNISEKDLEDVIYHNEAYSRSNSSVESSPVSSKHSLKECIPSPKSGSFVSAVIGAIRNAATHPFATKSTEKKSIDSSKQIYKDISMESSSDILDFETEPCLMMESVLEDVPITDTYSHNMVSSSDSLRRAMSFPETVDESCLRKSRMGDECTSLTNLSQAILHRRKVEDEEEEEGESISESENGISESRLPLSDFGPNISLVDQVIDVDNLVTKLLKVLRIIQLDNDTCIQELKEEKSDLESKVEITAKELLELQKLAGNLRKNDEVLNTSADRRQSVMDNCRLLIKEAGMEEFRINEPVTLNTDSSELMHCEDLNANSTSILLS